MTSLHKWKTARGFEILEFTDANNCTCSIQQSSGIRCESNDEPAPGTSLLWLGCNNANPRILASEAHNLGIQTTETTGWVPFPVPENVLFKTRMLLDRRQAAILVVLLNRWLETGHIHNQDN